METQLSIPPEMPKSDASNRERGYGHYPFYTGYLFLILSFSLYAISEYADLKDNLFMLFCVHYFICCAYVSILIYIGALGVRKSWQKKNMDKTMILLNMFLVSAYALN